MGGRLVAIAIDGRDVENTGRKEAGGDAGRPVKTVIYMYIKLLSFISILTEPDLLVPVPSARTAPLSLLTLNSVQNFISFKVTYLPLFGSAAEDGEM